MAWTVKTELVGTEPVDKENPTGDMTDLTKITATHIETGEVYLLKARMGTDAYKKAAWDDIFVQHEERIKSLSDVLAAEGVTCLNAKEAP